MYTHTHTQVVETPGPATASVQLTRLSRGRVVPAGVVSLVIDFAASGTDPIDARIQVPRQSQTAAESGPDPSARAGPPVVTRREIREMPAHEQDRFCLALKKTMENKAGPQSSEYFEIAGYHGWPSDHCHHGQETFPGWHRGYCVRLERAIIKADLELGNDGNIGLPYWDWSDLNVGGQVMPQAIRRHFGVMPEGLVNRDEAGSLGSRGYSQIRGEAALRSSLLRASVASQAEQCLAVAEHYMHASTRFNRQGYSVEAAHNGVHMSLGFPMTSLRYSAFHPIFFLHHCNVDRIYEKHLSIETPEESMREFQQRQLELASKGEQNRFRAELTPFSHPVTGRPLLPADTAYTKDHGLLRFEGGARGGSGRIEFPQPP